MKRIFILIFTLSIITACKNDSTITNQEGDLRGTILINLNPAIGASVSIPKINKISITDSNGVFTIKDLIEGIYDIFITKDGYDSTAIFGLYFPGYNININMDNIRNESITYHSTEFDGNPLTLYKTGNSNISNISVDSNFTIRRIRDNNKYINDLCVEIKGYNDSNMIFCSNNSNINRFGDTVNYDIIANDIITVDSNLNYYIYKTGLNRAGFITGQIVYLTDFKFTDYGFYFLQDKRTKRIMWMGLSQNHSNIVSITVP